MIEQNFIILNRYGLHVRPCSAMSREAMKYNSDIKLIYRNQSVNAKVIMSLLTLAVEKGQQVTVQCSGNDEKEALEAIGILINNQFGLKEDD
jgi:phosphocarrier protein